MAVAADRRVFRSASGVVSKNVLKAPTGTEARPESIAQDA